MTKAWAERRAPVLVLILIALLGLPSLGGGLISDDHFVVPAAAGSTLASWTGGLFHHAGRVGTERAKVRDMYRPVALTTLAADHALHGERPWGYHLTSWLLHLALCGLVFLLLERTNHRQAALLGTLIVGLHPAAAESWLWISGRFDLLMTLFLVLAWLLLEQRRHGAAFVAGLAACLSKEPAVLGLAALAVRPRWPGDPSPAEGAPGFTLRPRRALIALGGAAALALAARWVTLGGLRAGADRPLLEYLRHWTAPWIAEALATILLPVGPSFIEPGEAYNRLSTAAVAGCAVGIAALVLVSWRLRRRWPSFSWGIAAALAQLLLAVPMLTIGKGRFLCAPLLFLLPGGLGLATSATAWLRGRLGAARARALATALAAAYLFTLGVQLLDATAAFHDEMALWTSVAEERPDLSQGPGLQGLTLLADGRADEAAAHLERAYALAPQDARWIEGLARIAASRGDYRRCEALDRHGATLAPGDVSFAVGRATCLRALGDTAGARAEAQRGLRLAPAHPGLSALLRELDAPARP